MMGYQRGSLEDVVAQAIGGMVAAAVILALVVVVAATVTALVMMCTEIAKVHLQVMRTSGARWLWIADAGLGMVILLGFFLAALGAAELTVYLLAWSFLLYVSVIEFLDHTHCQDEPDLSNLDSYLGDFTGPSTNGNIPSAAAH